MRWSRRDAVTAAVRALVLLPILVSGASPDRHLSVYSTAANYSLPLTQRDGRDYVGLLELLEPLGAVNSRTDGDRWRLRYNRVQGEFTAGKSRAVIQGRPADFAAPFILENGRGLISVSSIAAILPRFLGGPVSLHETAGRLFIGSVATHFTASLAGENPPRLVFNFTSSVSPSVSTEPGSLRMTFTRDPVVPPASPILTFGSKTIPSAAYNEINGAAVITVSSTAPVIASFSNDGRTVTISPATAAAQKTTPQSLPPVSPPPPTTAASNSTVATANRRFFAVVDASHGGTDLGATISTALVEKDITLSLSRSLHQELESRGIATQVVRDGDLDPTLDQRAAIANSAHAAVYISLHASSTGHGVRVYTSLLPYSGASGEDRGPFRAWSTAQNQYLELSQIAASSVAAEMQRRQIPVESLSAPLRPLNNVTAAAIAVEVAPQGSDVNQLAAPDYQQLVTSAVATALAAARDKLGVPQ